MNQEYPKRTGLAGGVAKVLNVGGSAVLCLYDAGSYALGGLISLVKKAPGLPQKATGMFTGGLGTIRPSETKSLDAKIKDYEKKIQALYLEIGKEGSKHPEAEGPLEAEAVKRLIEEVREYEKEIQRLRDRIAEIEAERKEEALRSRKRDRAAQKAVGGEKPPFEQITKTLESAINKALKQGVFETTSERAIFDKVAHDLLDSEMEIKILAAAELGKIGNEAAVPILCEAAAYDEPNLMSEVINSLINIGDARAIPLFKAKVNDLRYRVRIGCLRGLYKLAPDAEAMPLLIDALRDQHPEVRRTAATFIGWKDYADALPALIQSLRDDEERVRKAAVSSLANIKDEAAVLPLIKLLGDRDPEVREKTLDAIKMITGEELNFDVHASGQFLTDAIESIRIWWQKERAGQSDQAAAEEAVAAEALEVVEAEEISETVEAVQAEEPAEVIAATLAKEETEAAVEAVGTEEYAAEAEESQEDVAVDYEPESMGQEQTGAVDTTEEALATGELEPSEAPQESALAESPWEAVDEMEAEEEAATEEVTEMQGIAETVEAGEVDTEEETAPVEGDEEEEDVEPVAGVEELQDAAPPAPEAVTPEDEEEAELNAAG